MSERAKKYRARKKKLKEIWNLRKHVMAELTINKVKVESNQTTNELCII